MKPKPDPNLNPILTLTREQSLNPLTDLFRLSSLSTGSRLTRLRLVRAQKPRRRSETPDRWITPPTGGVSEDTCSLGTDINMHVKQRSSSMGYYCAVMLSSQPLSHCLFIVHRALPLCLPASVRFSTPSAKCIKNRRLSDTLNVSKQKNSTCSTGRESKKRC